MAFGRVRDPRQARFLTLDSLRWVIRNRAWSWWYLVRYWRFFWWRLRNRHIITEGFVFLGRRVQVEARKGYARLIMGRWVHVGDENRIRAHEGTMRIGDKCVFGRDNTVNGYLDIEFGEGCIVADWVYVCDFDHVYDDVTYPIKDQGLVKSPVRIGPDCWLGTKVTVLRGTTVGHGTILAANSVVRGDVPPESIVAGVPGRVVKNRREVYEAKAEHRAALADIQRKTSEAAQANASQPDQSAG
ncbi:MAG: Acyltransferase [Actinomycetota bacterium]|nr:Acyltransferase [Actinomycetota bacterium]